MKTNSTIPDDDENDDDEHKCFHFYKTLILTHVRMGWILVRRSDELNGIYMQHKLYNKMTKNVIL